MREAKKSHCFEHVQRRPRETARDHSRGSSPAELTVGVDELTVGAQNGHGDGRLQEKHVVVDSLRLDDFVHLSHALGRSFLRLLGLLPQVFYLGLQVAEKFDGLHQDVDFALVDHGACGLGIMDPDQSHSDDIVQFVDFHVHTLHATLLRRVVD